MCGRLCVSIVFSKCMGRCECECAVYVCVCSSGFREYNIILTFWPNVRLVVHCFSNAFA